MDQKRIIKQMIDFNKAAFDNTYNAMVMLQEQNEKIAATVMDKADWMPAEGRKAVDEWIGACKKGRDEFKKAIDDNFTNVEKYFA